jgi:hypothetical protein
LTKHGSDLACKNPRKSVWKKPRKLKDTPQAWLRRLICGFDFGLKITTKDPETGKVSSHPIHYNKNQDVLAAFRDDRRWMFVDRLSNSMLDAHWKGEETFYFTAAGSSRNKRILVNLDIDCHASGTKLGAFEAAEYLKANFSTNLYHEPSTNGNGRHGYFVLEKCGINAEGVKELLKDLERRLNEHLLSKGFDIELFEIKGLPPVLTWNDEGEVTNFTAGVLAKIPREVHRFQEWKATTVLTDWDVRRLISRLRPTTLVNVSITPKPTPAKSDDFDSPKIGSMMGKVIGEGELAQLTEGGHYSNVAASLLGIHNLKTTGRTIVTIDDVAVFLLCLKFFTGRMNADGTLPVKRFQGLWSSMYEIGDVDRAFDCHRFKVIRDYLSDLGLLDWEDMTFVAPTTDYHGRRFNGCACKWKASQTLMGMLDWEKSVVEVVTTQDMDIQGEKEEEGEASLVGTRPFLTPPPVFKNHIQIIRSLSKVPEGEEIRPIEVLSIGRQLRLFTPEAVTGLVMNFEDSMERLAA